MVNPPLTEKQVYLALKDIFGGNELLPSTPKKIRKRVEKSKEDVKIKPLVQTYGIEGIAQVAKVLLDDQVFVLRTRAKARFPELFESLPSQPHQPSTTETTITTSSASPPQRGPTYSSEELLGIGDKLRTRTQKERNESIEADCQTKSLDCVSLPLWDQHRLLVRIQYALEKACFNFAQKRLIGLLQREEWDCAEAVELQRWAKVLFMYREELSMEDVKDVGKPLPILLDAITQLRHDAVHRIRLSSSGILQHMTDAGLLSRLVQDEECSKFISALRMKTHDAIGQLVCSKQLLDDKMTKIKKDFAAKRAELERQETALLEAAVREHKEPVLCVSGSLDRVSDDLGGLDATNAPWKHGYDPDPSDQKPPESEDTTETHAITPVPESVAQPADTKVSDAAKGEIEMAGVAEEEEAVKESIVSREPIDAAVEDCYEDVEIAQQPSEPLIPVPIADNSSIELAIADSDKDYCNGKDEDALDVEHYFECPEIVLDSCESNPKHISNDPPFEQEIVTTDTRDTSSEARGVLDSAAASESPGSDLVGHDQGSFYEPNISPAPACDGQAENHADESHTKSETEDGISTENGIVDPGASSEQPAATNGPSYLLRSWGPGSWSSSVRIKSLEDDPRLKSLTVANGKGRVTLVST